MTIYIINMKTTKLAINPNPAILHDMRVFSSAVRTAFKNYQNNLSEKDIRKNLKTKFNLNCWLIESARLEAKKIYESVGTKHIIFGGKYNGGLFQNRRIKRKSSVPRRV